MQRIFYRVTEAARRAGVAAGTVRSYCHLGLLVPLMDSGGNRLFTDAHVEEIRAIYRRNVARRNEGRERMRAGRA